MHKGFYDENQLNYNQKFQMDNSTTMKLTPVDVQVFGDGLFCLHKVAEMILTGD